MTIVIESIILCIVFSMVMAGPMFVNPLVQIHNYPPAIGQRALELGMIQKTQQRNSKRVYVVKAIACMVFAILMTVLVYFVNGARSFVTGFGYSYLLWCMIDWFDAIVLDIGLFCHCKRFVLPGTEDMKKEYHDYWFHIKGSFIGMILGLPACLIVGLLVQIFA